MTILEELYYGNLNPTDIVTLPNKQTESMLALVDRNKKKLEETMNAEQYEALERYAEASAELSVLTECEAFVKGFSLAAKILAQAMT